LGVDAGHVNFYEPKIGAHPRLLGQHEDGVSGLAFSPDGKQVASAAGEEPVFLWDTSSVSKKSPRCRLSADHDYVDTVAFSPDGRTLATGSLGGAVRLWDVSTCAALMSLPGHRNAVVEVMFSPNGRDLASASWDGTVRLWDRLNGKEKMRFDLDVAATSVVFSPDGNRS